MTAHPSPFVEKGNLINKGAFCLLKAFAGVVRKHCRAGKPWRKDHRVRALRHRAGTRVRLSTVFQRKKQRYSLGR